MRAVKVHALPADRTGLQPAAINASISDKSHRRRAPSLQPHGSAPWSANRKTWRQLHPRMRPTSLASTRRRAAAAVAVDPGVRVEVVTLYPSGVSSRQAHCLPTTESSRGFGLLILSAQLVRKICRGMLGFRWNSAGLSGGAD